ncbi:hypothetical protein Tco_1531547 [Tanacetum coccineum]
MKLFPRCTPWETTRNVRCAARKHQDLVRSKVLSNVDDRWAWDLNGGGDFCVKDACDLVDEVLLPKENVATRWIKTIPIKEDTSHLFFSCDVALAISRLICRGGSFLEPVVSYSGLVGGVV